MRISLQWLRDYVDVPETAEELAHLLTMAGLEVSAIEMRGADIGDVVVAQIEEKGQHPDADRLSLCRVTDGTASYPIVCGATNMVAGDKVALARVGSKLPGNFKIKRAKIRGQVSEGMMCSNRELALSDDHAGIIILPSELELGQKLVDVLGLPDTVIEVEITPNRPDWLSVVGVAREVAALTGRELKLPQPQITESAEKAADVTSVTIKDADLCHRYAARLIRGVTIGPSPLWLQTRLEAAGVRPISNVVDVTNYVLMELGHPLHAFDFNRLRENRIVVKRAGEGEKFTTLDGEERTMNGENLMICDGAGSVAVAGVMGGLNSEVEDSTSDVLLESAWFLPGNIRRTSKELGLKTEAAYRFERGADVEGLMLALERATELIVELAGGTVSQGIIDAYPTPRAPKPVTLRTEKCSSLLGMEVQTDEAARLLSGLGMKITEVTPDTITAVSPPFRVDIEREADLIEEVARLKGYHNIPVTLPRMSLEPNVAADDFVFADEMRDAMVGAGLREAITYAFIDPADDDRIALPADSPLREKVPVANPLGQETSVMRTSLLPGLMRVAGLNVRRGQRDVRLFEVGRTFHPVAGEPLPDEIPHAAGLLTGRRDPLGWWGDAARLDFFDGKGVLETVLPRLGMDGLAFAPADDIPWLQPGRAASVSVGDIELGWLGEINPDLLDDYEMTPPVVAFHLNLRATLGSCSATPAFPGLDKFPTVERDLALLVDRDVTAKAVEKVAGSLKAKILRSIVLFDAFEGGKIPDGKQSLAFRVTYRSDERTLTEDEVATVEEKLVTKLSERLGARLRDS